MHSKALYFYSFPHFSHYVTVYIFYLLYPLTNYCGQLFLLLFSFNLHTIFISHYSTISTIYLPLSIKFILSRAFLLLISTFLFSLKNSLNISYNASLVMINFFSFCLSGKLFSCSSILNDSFAGHSDFGCRPFVFYHFEDFLPVSSGPQSFC